MDATVMLREFCDAVERHDGKRFADLFCEDGVYHDVFYGEFAGRAKIAEMIASNAAVTSRWITDDELAANPGLVKTMSVKPPMGTGHVRLIEIAGLDLQPCGGTHVRSVDEIGAVRVTQIEKKGKQNRRVRLAFA